MECKSLLDKMYILSITCETYIFSIVLYRKTFSLEELKGFFKFIQKYNLSNIFHFIASKYVFYRHLNIDELPEAFKNLFVTLKSWF